MSLIILCILTFPSLIVSNTGDMAQKDVLDAKNAVRNTLLTGIAGSLFIVTSLFTWRQIQITREGQITDRYGAAVQQLAGDSITVRTGGIYALGRIAEDSKRDESTIVELLCAFCRERTAQTSQQLTGEFLSDRYRDVQIALDVLSRPQISTPVRLDGANLEDAYLGNANLVGGRFAWAKLAGARFQSADLRGATFREAQLEGANFEKADLSGADLSGADLSRANLRNAKVVDIRYNLQTRWPAGFAPPPRRSAVR